MVQPTVERHRTALHRIDLSRPIRLALEEQLITRSTTVFDYGCGRGGDIRRLDMQGITCSGWDPAHHPDNERIPADVVNLGYVVNVIEDPEERAQALRGAWALTQELLIVSARTTAESATLRCRPFQDGGLTRWNTFQKLFEQQELRQWIDATLNVESIAAAPGIFYVFRDGGRAQAYLATRYRRRTTLPRVGRVDALYEQHQTLLEPLVQFYSHHGRIPEGDELITAGEIIDALGSLRRAFALVRQATDSSQWEQVQKDRAQDLLVYLAMSKFGQRPPFSKLPTGLQRDIRALFSSYKHALEEADELLFSVGKQEVIDAACRASPVGKLTREALYLHIDALNEAPPLIRVYEGCARAYVGSVEDVQIVKFHREKPQVSYLSYPDFDRDPHPALTASLKVRFAGLQIEYRDYSETENPFILHRKETFLSSDHPLRAKFERLTKQEERHNLFEQTTRIGTRKGWQAVLDDKGVALRGHRVVVEKNARSGRKEAKAD